KLTLAAAAPLAVGAALGAALARPFGVPVAAGIGAGVALVLWAAVSSRVLAPVLALFRAMGGTVASYRDGDFGFDLRWDGEDELRALVRAHNELGRSLRGQRLALVQRELLLDTMVQHTPVAMVLIDPARRVVLANVAARRLFG